VKKRKEKRKIVHRVVNRSNFLATVKSKEDIEVKKKVDDLFKAVARRLKMRKVKYICTKCKAEVILETDNKKIQKKAEETKLCHDCLKPKSKVKLFKKPISVKLSGKGVKVAEDLKEKSHAKKELQTVAASKQVRTRRPSFLDSL
jgi:hypothetical protein